MLAIETRAGNPITAGEVLLVPVMRSWRLELGRGGLVWNRPAAVLVETGGGVTPEGGQRNVAPKGGQRDNVALPIRDWTRRCQLAILGAGLAGSLVLWLGCSRRRRHSYSRGGPR